MNRTMLKYMSHICLILILIFLFGMNAFGQGFIIPVDDIQIREPLIPKLLSHNVQVNINTQAAKVEVEQVFYNPGKRTLEGIYYFPLPEGATVSNFAMYVNGKKLQGELLEKEEARKLYEDIVRKKIDPALLEYVNHKLFRAKIFPIPPKEKRKITLEYSELLKSDHGLVKFVYPLRGEIQGERTIPVWPRYSRLHSKYEEKEGKSRKEHGATSDISQIINVQIHSPIALKNIYSPSHKIDFAQKSDNFALVSYEGKRHVESDDFILYYGLQQNDFGVHMLANRNNRDEDGFFMLLISPKVEIPQYKILNKDLVFVLDVSGSMAGEKIKQAKEALKFCINNLDKNDRFNIITFSTEPRLFKMNLINASEYQQEALEFLDGVEAKGGTNINEALLTALDMKGGTGQSQSIVFITDGLPTVGVTDIGEIRKNIGRLNKNHYRIFTFGVGYDVNTHLLDGIAQDGHAAADYIEPKEDIETTISAFYEKISNPVLASLKLDFGTIPVDEIYPEELPDLFKGSQLTVIGRYTNSGKTNLKLVGQLSEERKVFEYSLDYPEFEEDNDFLPRLWATRKIGYLMEQIRLNGEDKELRDEIVELSKKYGLVTPYTSYLVQENDEPRFTQMPSVSLYDIHPEADEASAALSGISMQVGKQAVVFSKTSRKLKEAESVDIFKSKMIRHVRGRNFKLDKNGYWIDWEYNSNKKSLNIKYGSKAYFQLLKLFPKTSKFLSLGEKVIFKFKGKFIKVDDRGIEKITQAELVAFFTG